MDLKRRRFFQVMKYGWTDSKAIAKEHHANRFSVYLDIWKYYRVYNLWSYHYRKENLWILTESEKKEIAKKFGKHFKDRDDFVMFYYKNRKFLSKWTKLKYESSPSLAKKRATAYGRWYNIPNSSIVQYGVMLLSEHYSVGNLKVGEHVLLARNVDIDFTGDIEICDHVNIAEGVKILTHAHDKFDFIDEERYIPFSNWAYKTPLKIGENVSIGTRAIIMPGVGEIGANAIISAGAVVTQQVPDNVIVAGNPAKTVGKVPKSGRHVYTTHIDERPF